MPESQSSAPAGKSRDEVRALYEELRAVYSTRNGDYNRLRRMYSGDHYDSESNPARPGYTLVVNYVEPTIDRAVSDLLARMPGIQVMPRGADAEARRKAEGSEGVVYKAWEINEAPIVFRRLLFNVTLLTRGVIHYWWDPRAECVKFKSVTPDNWYPLYDGETVAECILVSRRLTSELKRMYPKFASQIQTDRDMEASGNSIEGVASVTGGVTDALQEGGIARDTRLTMNGYTTVLDWYDRYGNWTRVMGNAVHNQRLDYGCDEVPFIPVEVKIVGDEVEPRSEVESIVDLNQYLDNLVSQQANIIRKYSDPPVVDEASGASSQDIRRAVQNDGGVIPIRKGGNLRYLNWEGPQPPIGEQYERVKDAIHDLTGRPRSAYGEMATNQSGVMTNLAMSPSTSLTENRQTVLGVALVKLNEAILRLYEKYMPGATLGYEGYRPKDRFGKQEYFSTFPADGEEAFKGKDIAGWYKNRIKWPAAIRTDDPMFVQNIISQVTSNPPLLSVYDAIEMLGHEDAEAMADRIEKQLEDPRWHPERLDSAISAATALQGAELPGALGGFDPLQTDSAMAQAAEASASPHRDTLADLG